MYGYICVCVSVLRLCVDQSLSPTTRIEINMSIADSQIHIISYSFLIHINNETRYVNYIFSIETIVFNEKQSLYLLEICTKKKNLIQCLVPCCFIPS